MPDESEISVRPLLDTKTMSMRDIVCSGGCRHKSPEECATATHMVFPYRGVYIRHVGRSEAVAEANQVLFFNQSESYRISHPVEGGDACISLALSEPLLRELLPKGHVRSGGPLVFPEHRLRIGFPPSSTACQYAMWTWLPTTVAGRSLNCSSPGIRSAYARCCLRIATSRPTARQRLSSPS